MHHEMTINARHVSYELLTHDTVHTHTHTHTNTRTHAQKVPTVEQNRHHNVHEDHAHDEHV